MAQAPQCTDVSQLYRVRPGDSLWRIAQRELGSGHRWRELAELNSVKRPYTIFVGEPIYLPERRSLTGRPSPRSLFPAEGPGCNAYPVCMDPGNSVDVQVKSPARDPVHAPIALKFSEDTPLGVLVLPGGEVEWGLKGEVSVQRHGGVITADARTGQTTLEYSSTQKAWGRDRAFELVNGISFERDPSGDIEVKGKVGLRTELFTGTFSISRSGSLKYEVEPKPVRVITKEYSLEGKIGVWIKLTARPDLSSVPQLAPIPVRLLVTRERMERFVHIVVLTTAAAAATVTVGAMFAKFAEMLGTLALRAGSVACGFIVIIVPPGGFHQATGQPRQTDYL